MAAKALTFDAVALTEKKMDMTLDDIIKMSKNNMAKPRKQRISNRNQNFASNFTQDKSSRMRRFMDTKSTLRQGALAQRRSNFQGNPFPLASQAARKAAAAPIHNKPVNRAQIVRQPRPAPFQRRAANASGFGQKQQQQMKTIPKQRPQTLDSLFANMKTQRTRVLAQKDNMGRGGNAGGQRIPPWQRGGRFGN